VIIHIYEKVPNNLFYVLVLPFFPDSPLYVKEGKEGIYAPLNKIIKQVLMVILFTEGSIRSAPSFLIRCKTRGRREETGSICKPLYCIDVIAYSQLHVIN